MMSTALIGVHTPGCCCGYCSIVLVGFPEGLQSTMICCIPDYGLTVTDFTSGLCLFKLLGGVPVVHGMSSEGEDCWLPIDGLEVMRVFDCIIGKEYPT